jgi:hypothetical protein
MGEYCYAMRLIKAILREIQSRNFGRLCCAYYSTGNGIQVSEGQRKGGHIYSLITIKRKRKSVQLMLKERQQ